MKWLRYSGVWIGIVLNPFHWQFKWERTNDNDEHLVHVFENCLFVGPVWVRVIFDDGRW